LTRLLDRAEGDHYTATALQCIPGKRPTPEMEPFRKARFGAFTLDVTSGELRKYGTKLRLGEQPFQILTLLLERRGELVSREELQKRLWPSDTFVDFDHGLNSAMRRLRDALGDEQENPQWVETVPRRGYRFVGEVEWERNGAAAAEKAKPPSALNEAVGRESPGITKKGNWASIGVAAALVLVLGAWIAWKLEEGRRSANLVAQVKTLAVLPLENLSGDAKQEYFADGMTDELITELAKSKGVRVISRTSVMQYKDARRPLREIGKELGADAIVEGTIALNGKKVRVTVQLIHVATDTHLWAQSYERDVSDVMDLQAALARNIANELKTTVVTNDNKTKRINPEAYDNYLKGRYAFLSGNGEASREYFEKAIALQPNYAQAYSGLADYYGAGSVGGELDPRKAMPESEKYARKALELEPTISEAHSSMAAMYLFFRWDWKKAEEEERRAIELNPNISEAYHVLSYILFAQNRVEEAVAAQRKGTEVDPFARPWAMGYVLMCAERYAEAEAELRRELKVRPTNTDVRDTLATVLLAEEKEKESAEELADSARRDGDPDYAVVIEEAFADGGNTGLQQMRLKRLESYAKKEYVSPIAFAFAYGRLRDKMKTMEWLEKAYEEHSPRLVRMWMEPEWKWMHGEPQFRALAKRVGLVLPQEQ
jgi:TolB-like protein/DNA-binding winged helix-turn-helix (wHTH) protein/Flp pilus assembly protein TadD